MAPYPIHRATTVRRCAGSHPGSRCAGTHAWGNTHPRRAHAGRGTQCDPRSRNTSRRHADIGAVNDRLRRHGGDRR